MEPAKNRHEALHQGNRKFYGNKCKRCGGTIRYTLGSKCVACTIARSAETQRRDREIFYAARKAQGQAHEA